MKFTTRLDSRCLRLGLVTITDVRISMGVYAYLQVGYDSSDVFNYYRHGVHASVLLISTNAGSPGRWMFQAQRSKGNKQSQIFSLFMC